MSRREVTRRDATATTLLAYVSSDDVQRRLTHMARLAELNQHDDTSEVLLIIRDFGANTPEPEGGDDE